MKATRIGSLVLLAAINALGSTANAQSVLPAPTIQDTQPSTIILKGRAARIRLAMETGMREGWLNSSDAARADLDLRTADGDMRTLPVSSPSATKAYEDLYQRLGAVDAAIESKRPLGRRAR